MNSPQLPPNEQPDPLDPLHDENIPEPTGPPAPSPALDSAAWSISTLLAVATGVFVAPAFLSVGRTAGATRSARVEWERRAQQIAEAEQASQNSPAMPAEECEPHVGNQ